jgi:hypothetical protein
MALTLNGNTGVLDNSGAFIAGTAVASTSGTSIDFTSIPSWVKRVTVMYDGVSTNGTGEPQIQLGTSGGIQTTGYTGSYGFFGASQAASTSSTGFILFLDGAASYTYTGTAVFTLIGSNVWTMTAVTGMNINYVGVCAGSKSLGGTLDRVRITTNTGTDVFDAGSINILYE